MRIFIGRICINEFLDRNNDPGVQIGTDSFGRAVAERRQIFLFGRHQFRDLIIVTAVIFTNNEIFILHGIENIDCVFIDPGAGTGAVGTPILHEDTAFRYYDFRRSILSECGGNSS